MALGNLTYKTPNPISSITADLTDSEGCGIYLSEVYEVSIADTTARLPYGIVIVGSNSADGTGSGVTGGGLEIVDAYGAVVQARAGAASVAVGDSLQVNGSGAFVAAAGSPNQYVWGFALTPAAAGEQFLMRFAPYKVFSAS